jgi:osomolarity two-component system response regulator SKN7
MMPELDGLAATVLIRQFDRVTPIISMTSNSSQNDYQIYLATGMNDMLAKPFSKSGLLSILLRYCSHLQLRLAVCFYVENVFIPGRIDSTNVIGD